MTIKKMFENILFVYEISTKEIKLNRCEQIADDYAIKFVEWIRNDQLNTQFLYKGISVKELLEIFKKENYEIK